jgi:glycosyltransferase involved in cell wall biosynthesis
MTRVLYLALDVELSRNRGDAVHVRNVVRSLGRIGHDIHLVVASAENIAPIDGVKISSRPRTDDFRLVSHVLRIGRKMHAEIVYERRFSPKISASVSTLLGIPYVVEYNGLPEEEVAMQGRRLDGGVTGKIKAVTRLTVLRHATAIVTVTEGLRLAISSRYKVSPAKLFVVPNGVDPERFHLGSRTIAREELGLQDAPTVGFVGNLVRWQGLDTLLQAMTLVEGPVIALVVGEGPEEGRLRERAVQLGIGPRIKFEGRISHDLVPKYIHAMDCCVAPFTSERNRSVGVSALKVYEYVACGRPVIVSEVPGAAELVRELDCGIVVPSEDPRAVAKAIDIIHDNSRYSEAAAKASSVVRDRFSWDRAAERLTHLFKQVVGG